jgi:hypothetical protein
MNLDIKWPFLSPVAVRVVQERRLWLRLKFDVEFDFDVVREIP